MPFTKNTALVLVSIVAPDEWRRIAREVVMVPLDATEEGVACPVTRWVFDDPAISPKEQASAIAECLTRLDDHLVFGDVASVRPLDDWHALLNASSRANQILGRTSGYDFEGFEDIRCHIPPDREAAFDECIFALTPMIDMEDEKDATPPPFVDLAVSTAKHLTQFIHWESTGEPAMEPAQRVEYKRHKRSDATEKPLSRGDRIKYLGGLLAGDLIGSHWEGLNGERGRPLLVDGSSLTDESAVATTILDTVYFLKDEASNEGVFTERFRRDLRQHREAGFSPDMLAWMNEEDNVADLEGNGAAIRMAAIALLPGDFGGSKEAFAREFIRQTHSAEATELALLYGRVIEQVGTERSLNRLYSATEEAWPLFKLYDGEVFRQSAFDSTLWWTLPPALHIGLTARNYTEMFDQVLMLGGDTDSIAAMAGAIGHARWGLEGMPESVLTKLEELCNVELPYL